MQKDEKTKRREEYRKAPVFGSQAAVASYYCEQTRQLTAVDAHVHMQRAQQDVKM